MLLDGYERFGPVFTLRIFHGNVVFVLGPGGQPLHPRLHAANFLWREGHFRDLIPLMGDGLLTIDGTSTAAPARDAAGLPQPRIEAARGVMDDEIERALGDFVPGAVIDLYAWARRLALRVALRALFGLDPDGDRRARSMPPPSSSRRSPSTRAIFLQILRGPGLALDPLLAARAARQPDLRARSTSAARPASAARHPLMLLDAQDEDGKPLTRGDPRRGHDAAVRRA